MSIAERILIDLEEKTEQASADGIPFCPDREVRVGYTVTWFSNRIQDRDKVKVIFTGGRHPFKEEPRLENNHVLRLDGAPYEYRIVEDTDSGLVPRGCGNITNPDGPPNR